MRVGTIIHPSRLAAVLANPGQEQILTPLVRECVEQGATHVELTGELFTLASASLRQRLALEIRKSLAPYGSQENVTFSVHLPSMGGVDISSSVEEIRAASVKTLESVARITAPLEPENFILHVAGMIQELGTIDLPGTSVSILRRMLRDNAYRCLDRLAATLDPQRVCIENLPSAPMEWLASFVEARPESVCVDVGHLTLRGESLDAFLFRFPGRVREVHLHDVKRVHLGPNVLSHVDHVVLGEGFLNLEGIVRTLRAHGFHGPVVLEVLRGDGLCSLPRLKRLLHPSGETT